MDFGPCYNCEKPSHLFPDGRCKNCTRLTPEEVTGEVSMSHYEKDLSAELKALGSGESNYKFDGPDFSVLEAFPRPESGVQIDLKLNITCPEFTSLCPKTGQPDFATIVINYRPFEHCVESKSLKMYLNGFRNHGEFHEACVTRICNDLVKLLNPLELEVIGQFTPRGGIPFWPTAYYAMND